MSSNMDLVERAIREELKGAIIKTVAFFDLFDYPLTLLEARKYLRLTGLSGKGGGPVDLKMLGGLLEELARERGLSNRDGFYFLPGRAEIINARLRKFNYSDRKIKKAKRIIRIFALLPWIRMAALGNLIGAHNLKNESDIDLFIITEPGKIWTVRLACNLITSFLGLRPRPGRNQDKICLSFFLAADSLDLKNLALEDDPYFTYWLSGLTPIFERGSVYPKLIKSNSRLLASLPNWSPAEPIPGRRVELSPTAYMAGQLIRILTFWLEPLARIVQRRKFPLAIRERLNAGTEVIANNQAIKLHVNDRREFYREEWKNRIRRVNNMIIQ